MKNYQIKNWIFFFFSFGLHITHILCPFYFDAYDAQVWSVQRKRKKSREKEREKTGESNRRVEKEEKEFYSLFFGLWTVLFPRGIHPY